MANLFRSFLSLCLVSIIAMSSLATAQNRLDQTGDAFPRPERQFWIDNVTYNTLTGDLMISNQSKTPLNAQNIVQSPKHQEISFFLPNTAVQPSPKIIPVQPDPIVKDILLEQRLLNGQPAVKVTIELYTSSPYVPFSIVPQKPGLSANIGKSFQPIQPSSPTSSNPAQQITTPQPNPKAPEAPIQQNSVQQQSSLKLEDTESFFTTINPNLTPIDDIFYDHNVITISSTQKPIEIQRSFSLFEPDRYVVDFNHAVLAPEVQQRAIMSTHPFVRAIRLSQFDPEVVRLVIEFSQGHYPIEMTQGTNKHTVRLTL